MKRLALHGGGKAVQVAGPHYTWPKITDELRVSALQQIDSTLSIAGSDGLFGRFERAFCDYHGRRHGVLFNSGTSALFAAFMALRLRPGDSVVVPDYTFFATASPLTFFPVDVRFADCDVSGNISAEAIERLVVAAKTGKSGKEFDILQGVRLILSKHFLALVRLER